MKIHLDYLLKLPKFDHIDAATIPEAIHLLERYRNHVKLIAGGTDLLVLLKKREVGAKYLINIKPINELCGISETSEFIKIGALTTISQLENSELLGGRYPALSSAAKEFATPQIRNMGTLGGNICNGSPAADSAPPLISLQAKVKLKGREGTRVLDIEDFFLGPGKTVLRESEILTEVQIPIPSQNSSAVYLKLPARTAIDIAVASVAAATTVDPETRNVTDLRLTLGGVAPRPMRALRAEGCIRGRMISDELIEKASDAAAEECNPISDLRGSSSYRRAIVRALTGRALREAFAKVLSDNLE